ncbi:uncharacterized protein LOC122391568 [Amphibalanus amphitrite]|uniref:uncharacterized protein LOC122391568 n=1 Tax=Amphibalanus amphitrite TaxID=1232801 RepID=UPI001C916BF0|nr:uncharacterized protein LOC122391568 [Amphibalanus amphitrite]
MWTCKLALLTLLASLAPLVAPAPARTSAGASKRAIPLSQFGPFDPYAAQLYGQRAYQYPYTSAVNNGVYGNGYYPGAGNYYDPTEYNYAPINDRADTQPVKYHDRLKTASNNGKYDQKYDDGHYDAKLYNSGKHNPRNYDSGLYDHAKYGTKPVHNTKKTHKKFPKHRGAESIGAGSRKIGKKPAAVGFFIRSDGSGGYNWGQYGQFGRLSTRSAPRPTVAPFVYEVAKPHLEKPAIRKKDVVHKTKDVVKGRPEKDLSFNTKEVFSKIDVFGPNHRKLFTGGKRVFDNDPNQDFGISRIELNNDERATASGPSGNDFDSYGFYSDLSNLYSEKPFDGEPSSDKTFPRVQATNSVKFNTRQPASSGSGSLFDSAPVRNSGISGSFDGKPARAAAGDSDSYGYYSDLSNLYGDQLWEPLDASAAPGVTQQTRDFDAGLSENRLDFGNQQSPVASQLNRDVPQQGVEFDSYGYYSNLDNLYGPDAPPEAPLKKKLVVKKKTAAGFDRGASSGLRNLNTGAVQKGITFDNSQNTFSSSGTQLQPDNTVTTADFDSYGFYSNLDNLYRTDSRQSVHVKPDTRRQSRLGVTSTGGRADDKAAVGPTRQTQTNRIRNFTSERKTAGRELDRSRSQNEVEFDSYGFYSDPRNLYA